MMEEKAEMDISRENPSEIFADLETMWTALDAFYQKFTPEDWNRKHGKDWTFADSPYHLAYFNQTALNGIKADLQSKAYLTLKELNAWNDSLIAERPSGQAGALALDYLHTTQAALRNAFRQLPADTHVFLPLIMVGGWRTLTFVLEYLLVHTWTHFTEASLRYSGQLPELPASLVNHVQNFNMQSLNDVLLPEDLAGVNLVTTLRLTGAGGGVWTYTMRDGRSRVEAQAAPNPDAEMTTDIATYYKTSFWGMGNPMVETLLGRIRIKGPLKLLQFQKIFAISPTRVWNFVEAGKIQNPV